VTTWEREEEERPALPTERLDAVTSGVFTGLLANGVAVLVAFVALVIAPPLLPFVAVAVLLLGLTQGLWLVPLAAFAVISGDRLRALGLAGAGALTLVGQGLILGLYLLAMVP
jgi:hypothetical protein